MGIFSAKTEPDPVEIDPREQLASAIAARDGAARRLEAAENAVEQTAELLAGALAKLETAKSAVVDAHESAPRRLLEMAATGALSLDRPLNAAQADVAAAENELAAVRSTLVLARATVTEAERAHMFAQLRVDDRCKPILVAEVPRIIAEVEALKAKFDKARATLSFLSEALPPGSPLRLRINDAVEAKPARSLPEPDEWRAAKEALLRDAHAPLPA